MLLNEHSINWFLVIYCFTHKAMYLSLNSHLRSFYLQWSQWFTMTYNWPICMQRLQNAQSEREHTYYTSTVHGWLRNRGAANSLSARGNGWLQGNHLLDTAGQLHIRTHKVGTICTKPLQTQARSNKSHHGERSWAHNPTPSWGAIGNCQLLGKGETVFWKSIGLGESTILQ